MIVVLAEMALDASNTLRLMVAMAGGHGITMIERLQRTKHNTRGRHRKREVSAHLAEELLLRSQWVVAVEQE